MDDLVSLRQQYRADKAAVFADLAETGASTRGVRSALQRLARLTDQTLRELWRRAGFGPRFALVAVGGYGRGELHPCSDIDVLILLPKSEMAGDHEGIERFLAFLWDIGLEVGHSVRTIDDCQRESAADVSVATTLIEARLLGALADNGFTSRVQIPPRRAAL